jgi:hypothetical protein
VVRSITNGQPESEDPFAMSHYWTHSKPKSKIEREWVRVTWRGRV